MMLIRLNTEPYLELAFVIICNMSSHRAIPYTELQTASKRGYTLGRRHSKMLLTIDEPGSKIARNSVFDCHLSPNWRQMAIENSVSNDFLSPFVDCINVFDCRLPGVGYLGQ